MASHDGEETCKESSLGSCKRSLGSLRKRWRRYCPWISFAIDSKYSVRVKREGGVGEEGEMRKGMGTSSGGLFLQKSEGVRVFLEVCRLEETTCGTVNVGFSITSRFCWRLWRWCKACTTCTSRQLPSGLSFRFIESCPSFPPSSCPLLLVAIVASLSSA